MAFALSFLARADTAHGVAAGGPIPSNPALTSGIVTSDIVFTTPGTVASGNAVTVNLLGLQHDSSGDLIINLSYIDSTGKVIRSVDIVNRLGATTANPYGTWADFGNDNGVGDNYEFNTDYPGNIWTTANCSDPPACTTPYGDADSIPGVSTDTVNFGQYFTSTVGGAKTNLSYAFAGLALNGGTWRLTITDAADPNIGSFVGWEIYITTTTTGVGTPQTINSTSGTPQSATVGASFANALQATVLDSSSNPVSGASVTFSAPLSGASATFGAATSTVAVTNSSGVATSVVPVANGTAGTYAVTASVSGVATPATFSLTNTPAPTGSSAVFQKVDTNTAGNWQGVYGADGSIIPLSVNNLPSYATVNFTNALTYDFTTYTSDSRTLLQYGSTTNRVATVYYNYPNFSMDVNFTDGNTHQLSLFLLDWDWEDRIQTIAVLDAATNTVLDTRTVSNFAATGRYLLWQIQGHVTLQFNCLAGNSAIVNGIFFDPIATSTAPPTVAVSAPSANASVSGTVTLTVQATSTAGISSVQFLLDGNPQGAPVTGTGPAYSTSWASGEIANGSHTLSATATDTKGYSVTSAPVTVTVSNTAPPGASVVFQKVDTTTKGNWKGVYGADGWLIPNDSSHLAAYALVNLANQFSYTWVGSTSDNRALLKGASTTDRIASTFYNNPTFNLDVNITDGQTHQMAFYLNDWDSGGRAETITITDANTHTVLDTRTVSSFSAGEYLVWNVQGHISVQFTWLASYNALLNGLFFDPVPTGTVTPPAVSITAPTAGATVTGNVTVTAQATSSVGIASVQFLLDGATLGSPITGSGPLYSTTWSSVQATNGSHSLTATATDTQGHSTTSSAITVTVSNGSPTLSSSAAFQKVDTNTAGNWQGVYGADGSIIPLSVNNIPSYATLNFTNALTYDFTTYTSDSRTLLQYGSTTNRVATVYYNYPNFSMDVNFTDGNTHQLSLFLLDWDWEDRIQTIAVLDAATNTVLDTRTVSNFAATGRYLLWQIQGHVTLQFNCLAGNSAIVNGIFFDPIETSTATPTIALSAPSANATLSGTVTLTAQATSTVGIASVQFLLDGNPQGAPVTGTGPAYSTTWASGEIANGSHTLSATATDTKGYSVTSAPVTVTVSNTGPPAASVVFQKVDTTTKGNWKGVYGADGWLIPNDSSHLAAYALVNLANQFSYTWVGSTSDNRALLKGASTTDRIASTFYNNPTFNLDVNITDGRTHQMAFYLNDWDAGGRAESITITDANTHTVLDTRTVSSFSAGEYLVWNVQGHISVQLTWLAGYNALLNGLFFDPVP